MRHEFFENGILVKVEEVPDEPRPALDPIGVFATLNAVLGVWPLEDAANAVGLTADDLIAEAQAWAVAAEGSES